MENDVNEIRRSVEVKFTINNYYYHFRLWVSVIFVVFVIILRLLVESVDLLPFVSFFIVWGYNAIPILQKSPSFCITEDQFIVTEFQQPPVAISLGSLNCIAHRQLFRYSRKIKEIVVSTVDRNFIIPAAINIANRKVFSVLLERSTFQAETKKRYLHGQPLYPKPPKKLQALLDEMEQHGMTEDLFLFSGPEKKFSFRRRSAIRALWVCGLMLISFIIMKTEAEFICSMTGGLLLIFTIILLTTGRYRHKSYFEKDEWLLVSPRGIAMVGNIQNGELFWREMLGIDYSNKGDLFGLTRNIDARSTSGLALYISTRDSLKISIPDIYDVPLPVLKAIIERQFAAYGGTPAQQNI